MRILVLGVGITPTKPLVATHMKGLIWLETALRVARLRHQIDCVFSTLVVVLVLNPPTSIRVSFPAPPLMLFTPS